MEMTEKEVDRHYVLKQVLDRKISQRQASKMLGLTDRQVRNLILRLKRDGPQGLVSKKRGKTSNYRKPSEFKHSVLMIVSNHFEGFGPTLAKEKLKEMYDLDLSTETLRQWMIDHQLWVPKIKKRNHHHPRARRACFGELIQADGSHHHWFGEDEEPANLTVFIDDATGQLTSLYFSRQETLDAYFEALHMHIEQYGRPRAIYTDRYSVFQAQGGRTGNKTQMHRALDQLEIQLILANSPQAKGRVERANRTLQDRLLKEMKLRGIQTIEGANRYCKEFMKEYNKRFFKKPASTFDAHRPLRGQETELILCRYETRTLRSDCTFQFNNQFYLVQGIKDVRRARGRKVEIRTTRKGEMHVFLGNSEVQVKLLEELDSPPVLTRKEVLRWNPNYHKEQSKKHPWKQYGYQLCDGSRKQKVV